MLDVGFTGTRAGCTQPQYVSLRKVLDTLWRQGCVWMHNGDAIGCDLEAARYWKENLDQKIFLRPCTHKDRAGYELYDEIADPKGPLDRNKDIVNACGVLVACSATMEETDRGGTWSTVRYARKKGKRVIVVYPDKTLKQSYLKRYKERGSPSAFVDMMSDKWDSFVSGCESQKHCKHVKLKDGQYIADVM